ncbi:MAG: transcriptional repressor [Clostridia bacterium]|nr:transcriptional repressor [Clostridia bacterium]
MAGKTTYHTRAQEELLAFLKSTPGRHHTANGIREHFAALGRPIGTATIYRQLEKFVSEGLVRRFVVGPGDCACYSYVEDAGCATHFHCKCETCGRLIHLDCGELREIEAHLLSHHGFSWDTGRTVFYGTCEDCRKA